MELAQAWGLGFLGGFIYFGCFRLIDKMKEIRRNEIFYRH